MNIQEKQDSLPQTINFPSPLPDEPDKGNSQKQKKVVSHDVKVNMQSKLSSQKNQKDVNDFECDAQNDLFMSQKDLYDSASSSQYDTIRPNHWT